MIAGKLMATIMALIFGGILTFLWWMMLSPDLPLMVRVCFISVTTGVTIACVALCVWFWGQKI
jgi:hypothetical protein